MRHWSQIAALVFVFTNPLSARTDQTISTDTTQDGGIFDLGPTLPPLIVSDKVNNPLFKLAGGATTAGIGQIYIGYQSGESGQVRVEEGSKLTNSTDTYLARNDGSSAAATITGAGSLWSTEHNFYVGFAGRATLNIENGGVVTTNNDAELGGPYTSSSGSATVNGNGSKWEIGKDFEMGAATLSIENGGLFTTGDAALGESLFDKSTVNVTGPGSTWQSSGELRLGNNSDATLHISNGGLVVTGGTAYLGNDRQRGMVVVDGTGSKWRVFDLYNESGSQTHNSLIVSNGGVVEIERQFLIGRYTTLGGNGGTVVTSSGVGNLGLISPGDSTDSTGVLTIDTPLLAHGNLGTIAFDLAGTGTGLYDQLIVSGEAYLDTCTIEVNLIDGFDPAIGDSFKLLSFGSLNPDYIYYGIFFDFSHATLLNGLSWDTSTFITDGTIRVVPEASSLILAGMASLIGCFASRIKGR